MGELDRAMFALLDRAADGVIGDPPVEAIVRRGHRARRVRRLVAVGVAAVATAAVVTTAVVVVPTSDEPRDRPDAGSTPQSPLSPSPVPLRGPTAQQIAHGTWVNIPAAPIRLCTGAAAAWDGDELLVLSEQGSGCGNSAVNAGTVVDAAAYDPASNRWRSLPAPPDGFEGPLYAVWAQDRLVVVSQANDRAGMWSPAAGWSALSPLPASGTWSDVPLAAVGRSVVAVGLGPAGDQVWRLDGADWSPLPSLPHPGRSTVSAVGVGTLDGEVYAVVATDVVTDPSPGAEASRSVNPRLLRLDESTWTQLPRPSGLPFVATHIEPYGDRLFIAGSGCPPFAPCPIFAGRLLLTTPGSHRTTDLGLSPLHFGERDGVVAGRAILSYSTTREHGGGIDVRPGDSAVFDPLREGWLRGPRSVVVDDIAAQVWTPYGYVVLGSPVEKCDCTLGGVLLRPAAK